MAYRVALADTAKEDAEHLWNWVVLQAPRRGPLWFEHLINALYSLERLPMRCPLAREAKIARRPIRCLLFGKRQGIYRILYGVDEKRSTVWILHIRHGALKDLAPGELAEVPEQI
jgi:plasmid stabilization system protein ParE